MARISVFAGHSGSGKTEIAVGRALRLAQAGLPVALVDLDTVNHYFRTRDLQAMLRSAGVRVVLPPLSPWRVDLPLVSPEVRGVLRDPHWQVLIDLGGDAVGSHILGQFAADLAPAAEMLLVLNPCRPRTATLAQIEQEGAAIGAAARLRWTGIIANPNLGPLTGVADVLAGLPVALAASHSLGVPVLAVGVLEKLAAAVAAQRPELPLEPLHIYLNRSEPVMLPATGE